MYWSIWLETCIVARFIKGNLTQFAGTHMRCPLVLFLQLRTKETRSTGAVIIGWTLTSVTQHGQSYNNRHWFRLSPIDRIVKPHEAKHLIKDTVPLLSFSWFSMSDSSKLHVPEGIDWLYHTDHHRSLLGSSKAWSIQTSDPSFVSLPWSNKLQVSCFLQSSHFCEITHFEQFSS